MAEFLTAAGKKVVINPAPFGVAMNLKKTLQKAVLAQNIDIAELQIDENDSTKEEQRNSLSLLAKILMAVDSDPEVEKALFACLERCTYGNNKIIVDIFEEIEARAAYYEIAIACVKENLLPFVAPLFSKYKNHLAKQNPAANSAVQK